MEQTNKQIMNYIILCLGIILYQWIQFIRNYQRPILIAIVAWLLFYGYQFVHAQEQEQEQEQMKIVNHVLYIECFSQERCEKLQRLFMES